MQFSAPNTVAAAIKPLTRVQKNLKAVLTAQKTVAADAASTMRAAEQKKANADAEIVKAEALSAKLNDFLGETQ